MTDPEKSVFRQAISAYGESMQHIVAIEEMAELTKEICKELHSQGNPQHLAEETADVSIMLDQMQIMHCNRDLVRKQRGYKVRRLKARLEGRGQR